MNFIECYVLCAGSLQQRRDLQRQGLAEGPADQPGWDAHWHHARLREDGGEKGRKR